MALNGIQINGNCYANVALAKVAYADLIATYPPLVNSIIDLTTIDVFADGSAQYAITNFDTGFNTFYYQQFSNCQQTSIQQPISDVIFISAVVICALLGLIAGQQR